MSVQRESAQQPKPRRTALWLGLHWLQVLGALFVLGAAVWYERAPLLRSAADLWIISDSPAAADVVAVFGGGLEDRPFAAASFYRAGLVRKVLVSNVRESRAAQLGVLMPHTAA